MVIQQLRPLGTHAAPSDTAAPSFNTVDLNVLSPRSPCTPRCQRSAKAASGSPLGGSVGVQHSGALHPCPNRVHPGHHGLFFHTTPTPLDALVDAKHQNAPSHCRYLSLTLSPLSLYPPLLGSLLFFPCLPSSCVCLIALSRGAKWRGLFHLAFSCARVSQSTQKMRHVEGKGELSASRVSCTSCQRLQKKKQQLWRWTTWERWKGKRRMREAARSWRQSPGSRCSWQKTQAKCQFL